MIFTLLRQGSDEVLDRERAVQAHLEQTHLLAASRQVVHRFMGRFGAGAHHHDHPLRVGGADVVEEVVLAGPTSPANLSIAFCTMPGVAR